MKERNCNMDKAFYREGSHLTNRYNLDKNHAQQVHDRIIKLADKHGSETNIIDAMIDDSTKPDSPLHVFRKDDNKAVELYYRNLFSLIKSALCVNRPCIKTGKPIAVKAFYIKRGSSIQVKGPGIILTREQMENDVEAAADETQRGYNHLDLFIRNWQRDKALTYIVETVRIWLEENVGIRQRVINKYNYKNRNKKDS
jgi:hypothetical protein